MHKKDIKTQQPPIFKNRSESRYGGIPPIWHTLMVYEMDMEVQNFHKSGSR